MMRTAIYYILKFELLAGLNLFDLTSNSLYVHF